MAYDQVNAQFTAATNYASAASSRAEGFITSLNTVAASLRPPELVVDSEWPVAAELVTPTEAIIGTVAVAFPYDDSGSAPGSPNASFDAGTAPTEPDLPTFTYTPLTAPDKPALEALTGVTMPTALGDWSPPSPPALLSINIAPFGGVDMHADWADRLDAIPDDLVLSSPTPFTPPDPTRYNSGLLTDMIALLSQRAAGGSGIAPAVEQAIWDRARTREVAAAQANLDEVSRNAEARGFSLPTGAFHAQLREAQKSLWAKSAELSRDVAIKQAELEQANAKHAIEQGIALETQLIRYVNDIEQRTFDAAKFAATNAVEIYNAVVGKYRVLLEKYSTYASIYRSLIEGEKAKVDVYRATVDAEKAKVDINQSLIAQQRVEIEIRNAYIALYRAEIEAAQAVISVDKLKVEAFGERVRAYTAEINAETVRVEAYKAQIQGNVALTDVYKSQVDAYAARIGASATAAKARAEIYDSEVRGFSSKVQAYTARVGAEAEKARTYLGIEGLKIDVAKLETDRSLSNNQLQIENYKALLGYYDMAKQVALQQAKILSDNYFALKNIVADASKVGAQVNAQMAASAYGTIHAGATISGADQTSTSFNYSGDTADTRAAPEYT